MGYHTNLTGRIFLNKKLSKKHLEKFEFIFKTYHNEKDVTFEKKDDDNEEVYQYIIPNVRCNWGYNDKYECIEQDLEKPYNYVEWINVICAFMSNHEYVLSG